MKSSKDNKPTIIRQICEIVLQCAVLLALLYFLLWSVVVDGPSMEPSLFHGDRLMMCRLLVIVNQVDLGDVVVLKPQQVSDRYLIKRIIGKPGDHLVITGGDIFINDTLLVNTYTESFTLGEVDVVLLEDEYFVLGDNRDVSMDSRAFGPVKKSELTGRILFQYFPFNKISLF